jgi:hypothetical protein
VIGPCSFSYIAFTWQNDCDQQLAAVGLSIPQDVIAILLQGFVRHSCFIFVVPRKAASS